MAIKFKTAPVNNDSEENDFFTTATSCLEREFHVFLNANFTARLNETRYVTRPDNYDPRHSELGLCTCAIKRDSYWTIKKKRLKENDNKTNLEKCKEKNAQGK